MEDIDEEVMKRSVITPDFERKERVPAVNQSRYTLQKMRKVCNPHNTKFSFISLLLGSDALEILKVCVYQCTGKSSVFPRPYLVRIPLPVGLVSV